MTTGINNSNEVNDMAKQTNETIVLIIADGEEAQFVRSDGTTRIAGWGIERTEFTADDPESEEIRQRAEQAMANAPEGVKSGVAEVDGVKVEWSLEDPATAEVDWEEPEYDDDGNEIW